MQIDPPFAVVARLTTRVEAASNAVLSGSARRSGVDHFLSWRRKVCVLPIVEPEIPSPQLVAARLTLDTLPTERIPLWAAHWIAAGYVLSKLRLITQSKTRAGAGALTRAATYGRG
jgi:hypothetical protein